MKNLSKSLKTKAEYKRVFNGNKIYHKNFMVVFKLNELSNPRLGLAIAKKHFKKAVDRNLIKRLIKEEFRHKDLINVDLVFVSLRFINPKNRQTIHQIIQQILNKIN